MSGELTGMLRLFGYIIGYMFGACAAALPLQAGEVPSTVYATSWGQTLAQDGSGFYNEVAHDVLARTNTPVDYQIMPYRRSKLLFFETPETCLYPSSLSALVSAGQITDADQFIESEGLFTARTHLFVRHGEKPPRKKSDLFGKSVAYPNGSVVRSSLEGYGAFLVGVNTEEDKAMMLLNGRVDVISGMMPDTALVFAAMKGDPPVYDPALVLYEVPVTFVCHKTAAKEQFITGVNTALALLADDPRYMGRLKKASLLQDNLERASGASDTKEGEASSPSGSATPARSRAKMRPTRRLP